MTEQDTTHYEITRYEGAVSHVVAYGLTLERAEHLVRQLPDLGEGRGWDIRPDGGVMTHPYFGRGITSPTEQHEQNWVERVGYRGSRYAIRYLIDGDEAVYTDEDVTAAVEHDLEQGYSLDQIARHFLAYWADNTEWRERPDSLALELERNGHRIWHARASEKQIASLTVETV